MNDASRSTRPLSVRFTEAEKAILRQKAGGAPLGAFIRAAALGAGNAGRSAPGRDRDALARLLGALGRSRLANNLNQLAKLANLGALPMTPETEGDLRRACAEIAEMRRLLLEALGIRPAKATATANTFNRASEAVQ